MIYMIIARRFFFGDESFLMDLVCGGWEKSIVGRGVGEGGVGVGWIR